MPQLKQSEQTLSCLQRDSDLLSVRFRKQMRKEIDEIGEEGFETVLTIAWAAANDLAQYSRLQGPKRRLFYATLAALLNQRITAEERDIQIPQLEDATPIITKDGAPVEGA